MLPEPRQRSQRLPRLLPSTIITEATKVELLITLTTDIIETKPELILLITIKILFPCMMTNTSIVMLVLSRLPLKVLLKRPQLKDLFNIDLELETHTISTQLLHLCTMMVIRLRHTTKMVLDL
jgi:hypothetical protein